MKYNRDCSVCLSERRNPFSHEWDCVAGPECPECHKCSGVIFDTQYKSVDGKYYWREYYVEPHGRMGNRSYNDDYRVGYFCSCGWEYSRPRRRKKDDE